MRQLCSEDDSIHGEGELVMMKYDDEGKVVLQ